MVPDVLRIGMAVSQKGIDPRVWVTTARVEEDPEAVRWVPKLGWIADVTFTGGVLDGESEIPCRVAGYVQGNGSGAFIPLEPGCEVNVLVNGGTAEESPVIIGRINNMGGCEAPDTVNGLPIVPGSTSDESTDTSVSPFDTEIVVSPNNRREEYKGDTFHQSRSHVLETDEPIDSLCLGSRDADQHYVRGEDFIDALIDGVQDLIASYQYVPLSGIPTNIAPGVVPLPPSNLPTEAAVATLRAGLTAALSQKIKGE